MKSFNNISIINEDKRGEAVLELAKAINALASVVAKDNRNVTGIYVAGDNYAAPKAAYQPEYQYGGIVATPSIIEEDEEDSQEF